jgi:branched-chain amino acid aminotransferase
LQDPGFGRAFTDHMVTIRYSEAEGWHDARVGPRLPIEMQVTSSVLHYAQEIFEGMKAYRRPNGGAALFRPAENALRLQSSARRMAMPELPEELFLDSVRALVRTDQDWIPDGPDGALYLRPFMIASESFLGVRPAREYLYAVVACAVGPYFKGDTPAVTLWATKDYIRAAPGGTGAAKCGGNYAASLIAQAEAIRQGCDQVVFLDAIERRWIEELGGMNIFFVFDDGTLITPPLSGTILPGITRASILTLAGDLGIEAREERYSLDQWRADAQSGRPGRNLRLRHGGRGHARWRGEERGRRFHDRRPVGRPAHQPHSRRPGRYPARRRGRSARLDRTGLLKHRSISPFPPAPAPL